MAEQGIRLAAGCSAKSAGTHEIKLGAVDMFPDDNESCLGHHR